MRFDFAIVGAPKAGTTSLVDYLRCHPDIFLPAQKEVPFFVHDDAFAQGERYLEPYYSARPARAAVGIAHVHMLHAQPHAARLKSHSPDARIVAVLRNPVERAYSAYWHMRMLGWEDATTFEEAMAREPQRLRELPIVDRTDFGYVRDGEYAGQLAVFRDLFGADRVRAILTDELAQQPRATLESLLTWLGLAPETSRMDLGHRSNVAGRPRSGLLHWLLARPYAVKSVYKALVPAALQLRLRLAIKEPLMARNLAAERYPPMQPATRSRLADHYAPHNARLAALLGRELPDWS
jgi:hypothetical protein